MGYQPSRRLETLLSALLPPVRREHVLGDLSECALSPRQYLAAFASVLPSVVFAELRRTWRAGTGVGLMAALTVVALGIAAALTRGHALAVPGEWLRWAAPGAVWIAGCSLAAAYGRAGTPLWDGWCLLIALAATLSAAAGTGANVAAAAGAIVVATAIHIGLTLPRTRADMAALAAARGPLSFDNLHERARGFQRTIWWRNARESAVGFGLLAVNAADAATATSAVQRLPAALMVAGLVCLLVVLHGKAGSRRVPETTDVRTLLDFYRHELVRQRTALRFVALWYLLPLAPGIVASIVVKHHDRPFGMAMALAVVALLFYAVARLNRWSAQGLDGALAEASALTDSQGSAPS